jgi:outer membrane protein TolC
LLITHKARDNKEQNLVERTELIQLTILRSTALCFIISLSLQAQTSSSTSSQKLSSAVQAPLSGRTNQTGSVSTTQSTTNTGGANSVNFINSSINLQAPYNGSIPAGESLGEPLTLNLEAALSMGLNNNLGAISQAQSVRQAEGQHRTARSSLLPNLSATISETVEQINLRALGVNFPGAPTVVGPFNYFDARAARLNQAVFDLVALGNIRSASQNVAAALQSARDARDLITLAVGGSYLQVRAAEARVTAARAQVTSSQAVYQQAADRLRSGLNARIDADRTQVQLQTDQQRLRSLQADLERQKLNLSRVIGLPPGQVFTLTDDFPFAPLADLTLPSALSRAREGRADLRAAQSAVRAAELAVRAAHAENFPSLSLSADYGAVGTVPSRSHGTFTVVGTLTIPLYQGGRVEGDVQQAKAALRQRRAELADTQGRIDQEIRQAYIDLEAAADQVSVAQSNVKLSQETLRQARDRFAAGVSDTVAVVQAQQTVAQADNDYISAVFEHNLAKVSLARALGGAEINLKSFLREK